jgi:hypothetical protein
MNSWLMFLISLGIAGVVGVIAGCIFTYFDFFKKEDPSAEDSNKTVYDWGKICGFAAIPAVIFGGLTYVILYKKKTSEYHMSVNMKESVDKLPVQDLSAIKKQKVVLDPSVKCSTLKYDIPYTETTREEFARHLNQDLNVVHCLESEKLHVEGIIQDKLKKRKDFESGLRRLNVEADKNTAEMIVKKYGSSRPITNPHSLVQTEERINRLNNELDALKTCGTAKNMIVQKTEEVMQLKDYIRTGKVPIPSVKDEDITALLGERYHLGGYWPKPGNPDPVLREGAIENTSYSSTEYDRKHNSDRYIHYLQGGKPIKSYYDAYNTEKGSDCLAAKVNAETAHVSTKARRERKSMEPEVFGKNRMAQGILNEYSERKITGEYAIPDEKASEIRKDMGWELKKRKGLGAKIVGVAEDWLVD